MPVASGSWHCGWLRLREAGWATILIGADEAGKVFYWLSLAEEAGPVVAEGCITGSEELMQQIEAAEQVRLQFDDGPVFSVATDGGTGGTRWVRLMTL
ncbi:MAG: hypothetical protein JWR89_5250 [Tardiphaga sp.]|jgi:hypothetical protein|uniref:hypothetical protein n=1 Tax=Tardiphaga sp. TaxID=1926292 RepID=UPI002624A38D|nr:hypothetical protein [Tardiphaga sp.]MDB5505348.1 hypothetical protein [Tardiphaga sp.]